MSPMTRVEVNVKGQHDSTNPYFEVTLLTEKVHVQRRLSLPSSTYLTGDILKIHMENRV
jgi:hypothetical protein